MRPATILAGILAMVATVSSGHARDALPDLPPEARPAPTAVYLEAAVAGAQLYVCAQTDALAWAWIMMASDATLLDDQQRPIGTYATRITMIPPPPGLGSTWEDVDGGRIVATAGPRGMVAGDKRAWVRYDAQSREGSGRFSEAKSILRISADWAIRPSEACSRANAGAEARLPYTGTDLFMK